MQASGPCSCVGYWQSPVVYWGSQQTPIVSIIIDLTHLENVEGFKLNVPTAIPEHVHHHFKIPLVGNVACHDVVVCAVEQNFAEQFERLTLGHVVA